MSKLNELTIAGAARALRARECTVRELWDACHATALEKNPELNAYLEIFDADEAAIDAAQKRIDAGDPSLLCGIPLAIKDNILIEGKVVSAASKMLEHYRATYDATVVQKLKQAGALFVGRANMDEFAMGSSTEHSAFAVTKNPRDLSRVPGGSSLYCCSWYRHGRLRASASCTHGCRRFEANVRCRIPIGSHCYGIFARSGGTTYQDRRRR